MITTVRDLLRMKEGALYFVSPETSAIDALKYMAEKNIGDVLILEDDNIIGIVSERDFVRRIAKTSTCELDAPVRDYMTRDVITVEPSQSIEECMAIMTEQHIRHLPVLEDDIPIGMISIGDVIKGIMISQEFTIDQMQKYIGGEGYNQ